MATICLIIGIIYGALVPSDCGPGQEWQWIPEARIYACTINYPAQVTAP